jgi:hypothetical protein
VISEVKWFASFPPAEKPQGLELVHNAASDMKEQPVFLGQCMFHPNCEEIVAGGCRVSDEDVIKLGKRMAGGKFRKLRTLWLVSIGLHSSLFLARMVLVVMREFQTYNRLGDSGVLGLVEGLKSNSSLQILDLVSRVYFAY